MCTYVWIDDVGGELFAEIEHVVADAELLRDASGVVDIGDGAAARIRIATPQLQRHAGDLVTLLLKERRSHRGVDTAREGDEDLHREPPRS